MPGIQVGSKVRILETRGVQRGTGQGRSGCRAAVRRAVGRCGTYGLRCSLGAGRVPAGAGGDATRRRSTPRCRRGFPGNSGNPWGSTARGTCTRPPGRSAARGDCGGGTPWPTHPRHSRLAKDAGRSTVNMQAPGAGAAQSARPGARPHIPGAHAGSGAYGSRVRGWILAIRRKRLNGRDAANYAGCTRFAHVRATRVPGACATPVVKRRPRWLNRVPGEGDPRTPRQDQAGRPAPSGITR